MLDCGLDCGIRLGTKACNFVLCAIMVAFAGVMPQLAAAQDASSAKPVTLLGTVQTLSGDTLTVKSDAGAVMQVTVEPDARVLRIEPGQKTLAGASPLSLADLQQGDRVMARGSADAAGSTLAAKLLVAIKSGDIAQKQQRERADWQKNGIGGLVKSVDPAASTVTISVGSAGARTEVIHASSSALVRHYAPGSVKFDQAVKGTLAEIKPGDQLRARGIKSADSSTLEAEEIVSGSFLNVAGAIQAVNTAASTITVNDAGTKKPVVIAVTPDSEVKKLDPEVAKRLAARLNGGGQRPGAAAASSGGTSGPKRPGSAESGPAEAGPSGKPTGTEGAVNGQSPRGAGDFQQLLRQSPSVTLTDLKKGDMVMVVATAGGDPGQPSSRTVRQDTATATAITVVAGVEAMLQASTSGSQAFLSSSWSLGGGGEAGGEAQ